MIVYGNGVYFGGGATCNSNDGFLAKYSGATGGYLWHTCISNFVPAAVATDASGAILVSGTVTYLNGFPAEYGYDQCGSFSNDGANALGVQGMVAKFSSSGARVWGREFILTSCNFGFTMTGLALDASGNVFVSGTHDQNVDMGCGNLPSFGGTDIDVTKFDPNGGCIWSRAFGDAQSDLQGGVAVDPQGNAVVVVGFQGQLDPGDGLASLTSQGNYDLGILKLGAATGTALVGKRYGSLTSEYGTSVRVAANGDIHIAGLFNGNVDFGGTPLASNGAADVFLLRTTSTGIVQSARGFGGAGADFLRFALNPNASKLAVLGDTAGA